MRAPGTQGSAPSIPLGRLIRQAGKSSLLMAAVGLSGLYAAAGRVTHIMTPIAWLTWVCALGLLVWPHPVRGHVRGPVARPTKAIPVIASTVLLTQMPIALPINVSRIFLAIFIAAVSWVYVRFSRGLYVSGGGRIDGTFLLPLATAPLAVGVFAAQQGLPQMALTAAAAAVGAWIAVTTALLRRWLRHGPVPRRLAPLQVVLLSPPALVWHVWSAAGNGGSVSLIILVLVGALTLGLLPVQVRSFKDALGTCESLSLTFPTANAATALLLWAGTAHPRGWRAMVVVAVVLPSALTGVVLTSRVRRAYRDLLGVRGSGGSGLGPERSHRQILRPHLFLIPPVAGRGSTNLVAKRPGEGGLGGVSDLAGHCGDRGVRPREKVRGGHQPGPGEEGPHRHARFPSEVTQKCRSGHARRAAEPIDRPIGPGVAEYALDSLRDTFVGRSGPQCGRRGGVPGRTQHHGKNHGGERRQNGGTAASVVPSLAAHQVADPPQEFGTVGGLPEGDVQGIGQAPEQHSARASIKPVMAAEQVDDSLSTLLGAQSVKGTTGNLVDTDVGTGASRDHSVRSPARDQHYVSGAHLQRCRAHLEVALSFQQDVEGGLELGATGHTHPCGIAQQTTLVEAGSDSRHVQQSTDGVHRVRLSRRRYWNLRQILASSSEWQDITSP